MLEFWIIFLICLKSISKQILSVFSAKYHLFRNYSACIGSGNLIKMVNLRNFAIKQKRRFFYFLSKKNWISTKLKGKNFFLPIIKFGKEWEKLVKSVKWQVKVFDKYLDVLYQNLFSGAIILNFQEKKVGTKWYKICTTQIFTI